MKLALHVLFDYNSSMENKITVDSNIQEAYKVALAARANAHAPYSKFLVGSALKIEGVEELIPGCNVENASYGGTICAERGSVLSSVAKHGKRGFEYIVVVTDQEDPAVPCAFCLQVLSEFVKPDFPIYLGNLKGLTKKILFKELLPHPFTEFTV